MAKPKTKPKIKPKNKGGRPRGTFKYKTPKDLLDKFVEYREKQKLENKPIFKRGFCVFANVNHGYMTELPKSFSDAIKRIDQECEAYAEEQLFVGKNVAGVIFNLTNNYSDNWKQKQHQELSGSLEMRDVLDDLIK